MLTRYGFAAIYIDDNKYNIRPTFQNIDKIGTPAEIVETLITFFECPSINWQYHRAVEILQACCEPKLPANIFGGFRFNDNGKLKLVNPPHSDFINDVIVLASHCLRFGVIGVTDEDVQDGDPLKEFDVYKFIGLACEHLGRSREQAADMTLTEFLMAWDIKFPEQKKARKERLSKTEQQKLFEYQDELDKKAAQKRAAKSD